MPSKAEDLAGRTFGRVTVLEFSHGAGSRCYWKCQCKCGRIRVMRADAITSGPTCRVCRRNDIANSKEPRQCFKCKQVLPRDKFHKNAANVDGINHICKVCNVAHATAHKKRLQRRDRESLVFPETKQCQECLLVKPSEDFWIDMSIPDGLSRRCAECAGAASRHWYNTIGKFDPERRTKDRAAQHGIKLSDLKALIAEQDGKCKICAAVFGKHSKWAIDHDHASGKIRGLLCRHCNSGLGYFRDSTTNLSAAIRYLETASGVLISKYRRRR